MTITVFSLIKVFIFSIRLLMILKSLFPLLSVATSGETYKISDNFGYANFNSINYSKKANSMTNLTKMNYAGILEYCNCHCYIPLVWGKNTFPTNIMNLLSLNFRYFCFKIFEKQLSEYQLNQMKKKFIKCYEGFDFELMQKIATKKYQMSKRFYNFTNKKFLYYINE